MFFSGGLIPFYLLVKNLGMLDSLWALILPTALSTYNMMIMRTALAGVPKALEEAAEIDGANPLVVLFRILIPLTIPTIAVLILYYAVANWNSWFNAMLFLPKAKRKVAAAAGIKEFTYSKSNGRFNIGGSGSR